VIALGHQQPTQIAPGLGQIAGAAQRLRLVIGWLSA
jgi:hypothetical protein